MEHTAGLASHTGFKSCFTTRRHLGPSWFPTRSSALQLWAVGSDSVRDPSATAGRSPRISDLHEQARQHYFHPRMGGRTSIKVVLPAVWESDAALRRHPWFACYHQTDAAGRPLDPCRTLPALSLGGDGAGEGVVREGAGAARVHHGLLLAHDPAPGVQAGRRRLPLQCCRLDTAAVVMDLAALAGAGRSAVVDTAPALQCTRQCCIPFGQGAPAASSRRWRHNRCVHPPREDSSSSPMDRLNRHAFAASHASSHQSHNLLSRCSFPRSLQGLIANACA
jgi:hypothetical protein